MDPKRFEYPHYIAIVLYTLLRREILRFMRIWIQTLLPPAVTTMLYCVIFGELVGRQLEVRGYSYGYSYMEYIIPGLILMSVITNSYSNVVTSFYSTRFHKNIEEMLISPMPAYILMLGFVAGGVARGLVVGLVVWAVSSVFANLAFPNLGLAIVVLLLTSAVFSVAGMINGIYAKSFDGISIIPTFILMPLTYLGGIFYSVEMLPEFWRSITLFNPIFYMIDVFRYGSLGVGDVQVRHSLMVLSVCLIVLTAICLQLLVRGVRIRN
ncbi:MAG: ABC transporter permease [Chromatiales bacterium]|nr:ABC transporter permease [Chromatiales bacterium]